LLSVQGYAISVYGYTDDVGTAEYNLKLSERRAQAVRDDLVQSGIDPKIITTKGYGKSDPRVPGDSAAAHATTRRVEIGIVDATLRLEGPGKLSTSARLLLNYTSARDMLRLWVELLRHSSLMS